MKGFENRVSFTVDGDRTFESLRSMERYKATLSGQN